MHMAPPYALLLQSTQYLNDKLDTDRSTRNVVQLFQAWHQEFDLALRAMGKTHVTQLHPRDLVSRSRDLAEALTVSYVGGPLPLHTPSRVVRRPRHRPEHRVH